MRMVFPPQSTMDNECIALAAKTLGHLAKAGGALRADFVDKEVRRALEWIKGERIESSRFAAVLVLKELAENAPTLFYQHVR
jgi:FKBP12-rapamycin complex-associated protein